MTNTSRSRGVVAYFTTCKYEAGNIKFREDSTDVLILQYGKNTWYITRYHTRLADVKNAHLYALHQESFAKDPHWLH